MNARTRQPIGFPFGSPKWPKAQRLDAIQFGIEVADSFTPQQWQVARWITESGLPMKREAVLDTLHRLLQETR